jgi:bifunctional non-homologous end joining protein LigD
VRKSTLATVLAKAGSGLRLNEHLQHDDGELVFRHACKLGLERIVSKRLRSGYRSGLSPDWLKEETCGARREAGRRRSIGDELLVYNKHLHLDI